MRFSCSISRARCAPYTPRKAGRRSSASIVPCPPCVRRSKSSIARRTSSVGIRCERSIPAWCNVVESRGQMIPRTLFSNDHEMFRDSARRFIAKEITPFHNEWEKAGVVPRELWRQAGEAGLLCTNVPEEYGGPGADFLYNVVLAEELGRAGATGPGFMVHSDMVATYILTFGTAEQKKKWLPGMVGGELIGALGLTEPDCGSDLKELRTR